MRIIRLTQGLNAMVDDEDFEYLNQFNWYVRIGKYTNYAIRSFYDERGRYKKISMHREILEVTDDKKVDHKDRNGLNNCKYNIRICTTSQNNKNRLGTGSSKYLGVSFCSYMKNKQWLSQINIEGRNKNLGRYRSEKEAALIYNEAAKIHHKEFANLNIIQ